MARGQEGTKTERAERGGAAKEEEEERRTAGAVEWTNAIFCFGLVGERRGRIGKAAGTGGEKSEGREG